MKLENLIKELKVRFGKTWMDAEIEEKDYPFGVKESSVDRNSFIICLDDDFLIWNKNGKIYGCGVWATKKIDELPSKFFISDEEDESFLLYKKNILVKVIDSDISYLTELYQYLTDWQYEELTNKPKLRDLCLLRPNQAHPARGGWITKLTKWELDQVNEGFYLCEKIKNPENVNLLNLLK